MKDVSEQEGAGGSVNNLVKQSKEAIKSHEIIRYTVPNYRTYIVFNSCTIASIINIIFMIMMLCVKGSSANSQAAPTATFTHYGDVLLAQEIIHVPIQVPMKAILQECVNFEKEANTTWVNFKNVKLKERMLYVAGATSELCKGFSAWNMAFQKDRAKRGLFSTGLKVLRTIFGVLSRPALKAIKQAAHAFGWSHAAKAKQALHSIRKVRQQVKDLAGKMVVEDKNLMDHKPFPTIYKQIPEISQFAQVYQRLAELKGKAARVIAGLMLARHGKLSTGLVGIQAAQDVFRRVHQQVKQGRGRSIPFLETVTDIFDCPVTMTSEGEDPLVLIHIPIIKIRAKILRYSTIPFQWSNSSKEKKQILQVKEDNWMVVDAGEKVAVVRKEELKRCWKIRPQEWVCHHGIPLQREARGECAHALYRASVQEIKGACRLKKVHETRIVALKEAFVLFAPEPVDFEVECPGKETSAERAVSGLMERKLPAGCSVWAKNFHLYQPEEVLAPRSSIIRINWEVGNFDAQSIRSMLDARWRIGQQAEKIEEMEAQGFITQEALTMSQYAGIGALVSIVGGTLAAAACGFFRAHMINKRKKREMEEKSAYMVLRPRKPPQEMSLGPTARPLPIPPDGDYENAQMQGLAVTTEAVYVRAATAPEATVGVKGFLV